MNSNTFPQKKGLNWCNSSQLDVEGQNKPHGNHFRPIQVTQSLLGTHLEHQNSFTAASSWITRTSQQGRRCIRMKDCLSMIKHYSKLGTRCLEHHNFSESKLFINDARLVRRISYPSKNSHALTHPKAFTHGMLARENHLIGFLQASFFWNTRILITCSQYFHRKVGNKLWWWCDASSVKLWKLFKMLWAWGGMQDNHFRPQIPSPGKRSNMVKGSQR